MGSGRSFAALSLPIGMYTYLMTRVLGALSKAYSRLVAGFCSVVDCSAMTGVVIMCRIFSLTFLATDTMAF